MVLGVALETAADGSGVVSHAASGAVLWCSLLWLRLMVVLQLVVPLLLLMSAGGAAARLLVLVVIVRYCKALDALLDRLLVVRVVVLLLDCVDGVAALMIVVLDTLPLIPMNTFNCSFFPHSV